MRKYLVVAEEKELRLPAAVAAKDRTVIVTGCGGTNVVKALRGINRRADILNVGYVGGKGWPLGMELKVGTVRLYHPNCEYSDPVFFLDGDTPCLTAGDFVVDESTVKDGDIVDMELAYICALGFRNVKSVKYVSDNFSLAEYHANT